MGKILVIGSLNMDLVTGVEKMPRIGETLLGESFKQIPGGKGANQACAAARLGGEVTMIGHVGNDNFGEALISSLYNDGVDTSCINKIDKVSTGIAVIIVDDMGDNSIVVVPGANYTLTSEDIDNSIEYINKADIIVTQLEIPVEAVKTALKKAKEQGKYTILNPAPAKKLDDEIIGNVDLLTPNETELEVLSDVKIETEEDVLKAAKVLINKGIKELIVTLGSKGCLYINKDGFKRFSSYKVDAVDTTAAGDSFTAAIAVGLSEGKQIDEAIDFASKVGALTVTKEGAQSSLPYRQDVIDFRGQRN